MKLIGHPDNEYCMRAIAHDVLCVASITTHPDTEQPVEWRVYIGAVAGKNHNDEWQNVAKNGSKLSEEMARLLFSCFAHIPYARHPNKSLDTRRALCYNNYIINQLERTIMEQRIRKVKIDNKGKVTIEYHVFKMPTQHWDEHSMTSMDAPAPDFLNALAALVPHALGICELPTSYGDQMRVSGVSFSYSGDNDDMGAVITAQKKLLESNSPLVINTPHNMSLSETGKNLLTVDCVKALEALQDAALSYVDGERAQMDINEIITASAREPVGAMA